MPRTPPDPARHQLRLLGEMGFGFLEELRMPGTARKSAAPPQSPIVTRPAHLPDPFAEPPTDLVGHFSGPPLALEDRVERLAAIAARVAGCMGCRLSNMRTNTVPGEGNPMAELVFVGEGPGRNEDLQGRPFVGDAGDLLTKIIEAMKFKREEVWIGNVVKCRPPQNRQPEADEMATCLPYLQEQIEIIRPRVIVALGKTALMGLLPEYTNVGITKLRGTWLAWKGIPLMPTFHPAYLLRSPQYKRLVWEDMQKVMGVFGRKV